VSGACIAHQENGGMDINVRKKSDVQLVQLRGELRLGKPVNELRETPEEMLGAGDKQIVLKLAEVPMIDSSGIGLLVRVLANARRQGGPSNCSARLISPSRRCELSAC
jgi:anti-anti-sigma factor